MGFFMLEVRTSCTPEDKMLALIVDNQAQFMRQQLGQDLQQLLGQLEGLQQLQQLQGSRQ